MTAPTALAFFWLVVGLILGAASASAFWWLWAFRAMHPHDELSEVERYAMRAAKRAEGVE